MRFMQSGYQEGETPEVLAVQAGVRTNPDYKSFSNVNGAELLMAPTGISVAAEEAKSTSVILDTEGNATIKGKEIEITADQDLSIGTPTGEGRRVCIKPVFRRK